MRKPAFHTFVIGCLCLATLTGCSISTHDNGNGKKDDVDIRTPFGSLSVHENNLNVKDTGLALYPGARVKKDDGEKNSNANVNISTSLFKFKVVAMKFESDDSADKVLAFYRKELGKYGKVIDCTGGFNMNFHHRDKDAEVTCNDHSGSDHEYKEELKVGTENNQHIVAVKPDGSGSDFTLVYARAQDHSDTM
ncbi:MAG TPA: hypothetical protein VFB79_09520 [Candidatus Angelobacter sp.]|nr:hypothetical protein [Candidatus Angelobacter sp.]